MQGRRNHPLLHDPQERPRGHPLLPLQPPMVQTAQPQGHRHGPPWHRAQQVQQQQQQQPPRLPHPARAHDSWSMPGGAHHAYGGGGDAFYGGSGGFRAAAAAGGAGSGSGARAGGLLGRAPDHTHSGSRSLLGRPEAFRAPAHHPPRPGPVDGYTPSFPAPRPLFNDPSLRGVHGPMMGHKAGAGPRGDHPLYGKPPPPHLRAGAGHLLPNPRSGTCACVGRPTKFCSRV